MSYFFSVWFKFILAFFALALVLDIAKYLARKKLITSILNSPDEKRQAYIRMDTQLISVYKKLLWMTPFTLLFVPAVIYIYLREMFLYFAIALTLMYIFVLEDFLYRRSFLKAIEKK